MGLEGVNIKKLRWFTLLALVVSAAVSCDAFAQDSSQNSWAAACSPERITSANSQSVTYNIIVDRPLYPNSTAAIQNAINSCGGGMPQAAAVQINTRDRTPGPTTENDDTRHLQPRRVINHLNWRRFPRER